MQWEENRLKYETLNLLLIETFPNLNLKYTEEIEWQEGNKTGSHTVYGDVFTPYVEECIKGGNKEEIKKIFDYIEFLLLKEDPYINEVVSFSVIESIECLLKENKVILQFLGEKTYALLQEF